LLSHCSLSYIELGGEVRAFIDRQVQPEMKESDNKHRLGAFASNVVAGILSSILVKLLLG
jgi:hypothetical protein